MVLAVKNLLANAQVVRDAGLILGLERSPGEGPGNPLQCSRLENPVDGGARWAAVHWVTQSWTQLKQLSMHAFSLRASQMVLGVKNLPAEDTRDLGLILG